MHIKLTVRWTFQTNNYRCICFITKIIIGLIVSQFMYSLGYSLIVCPYTLDSMNSYIIKFNRFIKIVVFWNWYDNAIEYVTQQPMLHFLVRNWSGTIPYSPCLKSAILNRFRHWGLYHSKTVSRTLLNEFRMRSRH